MSKCDTAKGGNQKYRVLHYMRTYGSITPLQALGDLGIMRLGARIYELKKMGYGIRTETEAGINRMGERTRYAKYSLDNNEERQKE